MTVGDFCGKGRVFAIFGLDEAVLVIVCGLEADFSTEEGDLLGEGVLDLVGRDDDDDGVLTVLVTLPAFGGALCGDAELTGFEADDLETGGSGLVGDLGAFSLFGTETLGELSDGFGASCTGAFCELSAGFGCLTGAGLAGCGFLLSTLGFGLFVSTLGLAALFWGFGAGFEPLGFDGVLADVLLDFPSFLMGGDGGDFTDSF